MLLQKGCVHVNSGAKQDPLIASQCSVFKQEPCSSGFSGSMVLFGIVIGTMAQLQKYERWKGDSYPGFVPWHMNGSWITKEPAEGISLQKFSVQNFGSNKCSQALPCHAPRGTLTYLGSYSLAVRYRAKITCILHKLIQMRRWYLSLLKFTNATLIFWR